MSTFDELLIIVDFLLVNSLMLEVELRCLEVNILRVFKVVNVYTLRGYNR